MKRLALICAGLLLPLSQSLAGDIYLNLKVGMASGDTDASQLDDQLAARGLNATASSSDDNRSAWLLGLGYQFTPNWAVELSQVELGKVTTRFSGMAVDINNFLTSVSDIHPQTGEGWQLSGLYRHPLAEKSWLVARAGLFDWHSDYTLSDGSVTRNVTASGNSATYGAGVEVEVREKMRIGVNYNRYSIDSEAISVVSAGITYGL